LAWPFLIIYKAVFFILLLPAYKFIRLLNKNSFKKIAEKYGNFNWHNFLPLAVIMVIGGASLVNNLQAREIRPENFGQKNILFQIFQTGEMFSEEGLWEEIKEGPLEASPTQVSYLESEALSQPDTGSETKEGIDTLVATTGDKATLISPEITDPEVVVKNRDKIIDYVVQVGDTLSTIAQKFGLNTNTILWENNLSYYSLIKPGQTLKILPLNGLSYKIEKGDTLLKVAKKYEAEINKIIDFNKLASAADIQIGQTVIIPDGKKAVVAVVAQTNSIKNIFTPAVDSDSKLLWPTNAWRITQYFGWRHSGLDIGNKTGQPVYASESGVVEKAGWNNGGYGYFVIINHGGGLKTLYAHLSKIYAKAGQNVSRGFIIGAIGSTGRSTGPHLHFEVQVNGLRINPLNYIR